MPRLKRRAYGYHFRVENTDGRVSAPDFRSLHAIRVFARNRLSKPRSVVRVSELPLGLEYVSRVGTLYPTGRIVWHRT